MHKRLKKSKYLHYISTIPITFISCIMIHTSKMTQKIRQKELLHRDFTIFIHTHIITSLSYAYHDITIHKNIPNSNFTIPFTLITRFYHHDKSPILIIRNSHTLTLTFQSQISSIKKWISQGSHTFYINQRKDQQEKKWKKHTKKISILHSHITKLLPPPKFLLTHHTSLTYFIIIPPSLFFHKL